MLRSNPSYDDTAHKRNLLLAESATFSGIDRLVIVNADLMILRHYVCITPGEINYDNHRVEGSSILEHCSRAEIPALRELFQRVFAGERLHQIAQVRDEGNTLWLTEYYPMYGGDGRIVAAACAARRLEHPLRQTTGVPFMPTGQPIECTAVSNTPNLVRPEAAAPPDNTQALADRLLRSEKYGVMGRLLAGIIHELNTPVGAINGATDNLLEFSTHLPSRLSLARAELGPEGFDLLEYLLSVVNLQPLEMDSKTKRARTRAVEAHLAEQGLDNLMEQADRLGELMNPDDIPTIARLLKRPGAFPALQIAGLFGQLRRTASSLRTSAQKATKWVNSIKQYTQNSDSAIELVELNHSLQQMLLVYHNRIKYGVQLQVNLPGSVPVKANPGQLAQVWSAVLAHVLDAMQAKGQMEVSSQVYEGNVKVLIQHDGAPFSDELLASLSAPMVPADAIADTEGGITLGYAQQLLAKWKGLLRSVTIDGRHGLEIHLPIALVG